ncbi:MAG: IS982 family transposase [Alphaproteobacteria bacterium]|nr:IS982 family transposase [Alphaproteobacteria bacterium]
MSYDTLCCLVDDFSKAFDPWYRKQLISDRKIKRNRNCHLHLSEILTILIAYHQSGMSCFKYFYIQAFRVHQQLFPGLVHYARFVKLIKRAFPALVCLLKSLEGEVTEYLFIDSTPMAVCHNLREKRHKTFKGLALKGKTSTGWFFGMKLHVIFNTKGEIVRLVVTPGNVNDRKPVPDMVKGITAKLIGDKGYLSKNLFHDLFQGGVTLITKIKKNMKNCLMPMQDKLMLMRRSFVETIFSSLKSLDTLIHHRHRCPINAFAHLFAGLIHYQLRTDKPSLHSITNLIS